MFFWFEQNTYFIQVTSNRGPTYDIRVLIFRNNVMNDKKSKKKKKIVIEIEVIQSS